MSGPGPVRLERLQGRLRRRRFDAFLSTRLTNIRYLTGFTGSSALLLVLPSRAILLTDGRYDTQARLEVGAADIVVSDRPWSELASLFSRSRAKRIGFEEGHITVGALKSVSKGRAGRFLPAGDPVGELRMVKEPMEIRAIESAVVSASSALLSLLSRGLRGRSESDVAADLVREMVRHGAGGASFAPIVAGGSRSALPHAGASREVIAPGDFVTIDFGARKDGYCSDETVLLFPVSPPTGRPMKGTGDAALVDRGRRIVDRRMREVASAVAHAQDAGIAAIRPGIDARDVDRAVRESLDRAGFLRYFVHSTGHGVGLDIHEGPLLSPRSEDKLAEGMVVTVEPGVYLPGIGGVRIEDTVRVTSRGAERITYLPKANLPEG